MDSEDYEYNLPRPLRRSARYASAKALSFEPTPRGPLKRTRKRPAKQALVAAVNGSGDKENGDKENGTEDESPNKMSRRETGEEVGGSGDENEMDVQESAEDMEDDQDQEMDMEKQDYSLDIPQLKTHHGTLGNDFCPRVVLRERCRSRAVLEDADLLQPKIVKLSSKGPAALTKPVEQIRSPLNRHDVPVFKQYKIGMESAVKRAAVPTVKDSTRTVYRLPDKSYSTHHHLNNIPTPKEPVQLKKKEGIKKTAIIEKTSSRGFQWYLWLLLLLALLSFAALLAYKKIPVLQRVTNRGGHLTRAVKPEVFADDLSLLKAQFPSQQPELWKRSKIHLEKHLKTDQPTEPVSLILTAGHKAERTLHCVAQGLASAFASALGGSILQIDGASKASQDSDEVKLDIDSKLKEAFEGDKPVAVIHRLEELPPGSTLIFYRYCDHESAAYKRVFLLFTVLLPQDEVSSEQGLKEVEELVQDYVKDRLVGSSGHSSFNEMDTDKYGGLWSRISHLILPVVSEKEVEHEGCG